jgi:hypothetical protein
MASKKAKAKAPRITVITGSRLLAINAILDLLPKIMSPADASMMLEAAKAMPYGFAFRGVTMTFDHTTSEFAIVDNRDSIK